jgi:murein DD-endopeptidase MepM/ murein hydrolase activator NlpD
MRNHPTLGGRRVHAGVDLAAPAGSPVVAAADGVVAYANWLGSYGLLVTLRHASGFETRFAHLSRILVSPGQLVTRGQTLGLVGSTGRSTGPHLHYEVRQNGTAIDPLAFQ